MTRRAQLSASALCLFFVGVVACTDGNSDSDEQADAGGDAAADATSAADGSETDGTPITIDVNMVACESEDDLSPNHSGADAYEVTGGFLERDGLHICADTDDWFLVEARVGQRITARIEFADRLGDLDLYLLPAAGDQSLESAVATAATREDVEELSYAPPADRSFYVRVHGFEGSAGAYDLFIAVSCASDEDCGDGLRCSFLDQHCVEDLAPICGVDQYEPNDRFETATPIEPADDGLAFLHGLRVCEEDDDYFVLELDEPASLYAELEFDSGNDLDLYVFDSLGRSITTVATEGRNPELLAWPVAAPGLYVFVVDQFVTELGNDVDYNLTLEVRAESCTSNADCGSVEGRQLCEDGACVGFTPDEPSPPGGPCDDPTDCDTGLICYENAPGFDDNFCTAECNGDGDCRLLDEGYCMLFHRSGVCFAGCETDSDCPAYFSCHEGGRCELVQCGVQDDCTEGQSCRFTEQQNTGYCTAAEFAGCRSDDDLEDNDTPRESVPLAGTSGEETGLQICDADDDWFELEVSEAGSRLNIDVAWDGGADIDVFIFDGEGRALVAGTSPDQNPEQADARFLDAGTYRVRVNQFPGERDTATSYTLTYAIASESCTVAAEDCLALVPLRIVCDEAGGGVCRFLEGEGAVELGGICDSPDDCTGEADLCWTYEPATAGRNICTIGCSDDSDCASVPGTGCEMVGRGFAACLP